MPLEIWQNVQLSVQSSTVQENKQNTTVTETGVESVNDAKSDISNGSKNDDIIGNMGGNARVVTTCVHGPSD